MWHICPQQGSLYKSNSSSKQIAQVDKTGIKPAKRKKTEKKHSTHQLKIGTILQKTLVSFLYKAVAENGDRQRSSSLTITTKDLNILLEEGQT